MKTAISSDAMGAKGPVCADEVRTTNVVCTVLMPHAPVLIPAVGGVRGGMAKASCRAMHEVAALVLKCQPDALLVISPHSPRKHVAFGLWVDATLQGSFAEFGAPQIEISLPNNMELANAIAVEAHAGNLATWPIRHRHLDHGALVPLWFLSQAGWDGPTTVLGLDYPDEGGLNEMGAAIAVAARESNQRVAIIASGDLSHRLIAGAPCGFHQQAHQFDEAFIELLRVGDYHKLGCINPELRELAAEDAVDSTLIAVAATNWNSIGHKVLSYEGPFGVGYGVAILFVEPGAPVGEEFETTRDTTSEGAILPELARRSVVAALCGQSDEPPLPAGRYLAARRGAFVTIRCRSGELRGCVGTVLPACENLVAETWHNARLAATEDVRFPPIAADELPDLRFHVSVIQSPEKISAATELDPNHYGVVVSTNDGRRGVLLPGIGGITTSLQQLLLARKKGQIDPDEPVTIWRFEVDSFDEAGG